MFIEYKVSYSRWDQITKWSHISDFQTSFDHSIPELNLEKKGVSYFKTLKSAL